MLARRRALLRAIGYKRGMSIDKDDDEPGRRGYHHGNLREALIKAALNLITEKGLAGFTIAEAARAAGVSAAAPYRPYGQRPPIAMIALHVWSQTHDVAALFARPDAPKARGAGC